MNKWIVIAALMTSGLFAGKASADGFGFSFQYSSQPTRVYYTAPVECRPVYPVYTYYQPVIYRPVVYRPYRTIVHERRYDCRPRRIIVR